MANLTKTVVKPSGVSQVIIATTPTNLSSAISVALAEVAPKSPDINNKNDANKRYKDLN